MLHKFELKPYNMYDAQNVFFNPHDRLQRESSVDYLSLGQAEKSGWSDVTKL